MRYFNVNDVKNLTDGFLRFRTNKGVDDVLLKSSICNILTTANDMMIKVGKYDEMYQNWSISEWMMPNGFGKLLHPRFISWDISQKNFTDLSVKSDEVPALGGQILNKFEWEENWVNLFNAVKMDAKLDISLDEATKPMNFQSVLDNHICLDGRIHTDSEKAVLPIELNISELGIKPGYFNTDVEEIYQNSFRNYPVDILK